MPGSSPSVRQPHWLTSDRRLWKGVGLRRPGTDQSAERLEPDDCEGSQRGVPSGRYVWSVEA